ncbi:peptidoglycan-binding protein [Phormidium sp. LEGE 05292]|uniref:peptidoglycan-binding domain-containing protein n=1 Tax=[Phormidium] sp. LEGE 05292 TaxID=767427 RepID=UPI00187E9286|nr:peptidoglycan-binding domain-containing protein [Phormidium sp. LEGE 05292]MBE9224886.1 peptidoglycan-binding protein [Phormidium sp. LEGE 05292]
MQLTEVTPTLKIITAESLAKDTQLAKEVQTNLIRLGLLDPPADGKFGRFSTQALKEFQTLMKISELGLGPQTSKALGETKEVIPLNLGNDLASRIVKYMQNKEYFIAIGERCYNIVYLEGAGADGTPNEDTFNEWNDRRMVIEIASGTPKIVGNWLATTEPGDYYTYHPMNPEGAARIAFGQYKAWQVGKHGNSEPHEALVQCMSVKVYRDSNKDGLRNGDSIDEGLFGINQHWGYDMRQVRSASAGCLVGQSRKSHQEFMALVKQDRRYQLNDKYVFLTTVIPGDDLAKSFLA